MSEEQIYLTTEKAKRRPNNNIPFDRLEVNQSVFRHFDEINEASLRSLISTINSKGDKYFKVIKHKEHRQFEIARLRREISDAVVDEETKIVESSSEAKAITAPKSKVKYPFNEVPEGKSFILPIKGTNEVSLKVQCCNQNKKSERKFILLKHEQYGMFEVYCVPKQTLQFFQPSAEMQEKVRDYDAE
jgi:hypothetical protein